MFFVCLFVCCRPTVQEDGGDIIFMVILGHKYVECFFFFWRGGITFFCSSKYGLPTCTLVANEYDKDKNINHKAQD